MVVHLRDQVRRAVEDDAALLQFAHGERDVVTDEIDRRTTGAAARVVRFFEQQAHAGTIEERQVAVAVEVPQPEHIAVERLSPVDIRNRQRDLPDAAEGEPRHRVLPIQQSF